MPCELAIGILYQGRGRWLEADVALRAAFEAATVIVRRRVVVPAALTRLHARAGRSTRGRGGVVLSRRRLGDARCERALCRRRC